MLFCEWQVQVALQGERIQHDHNLRPHNPKWWGQLSPRGKEKKSTASAQKQEDVVKKKTTALKTHLQF